jgi:hypothetical protein
VIARRNNPRELEAKTRIFKVHLEHEFGHVPLELIDVPAISRFRAKLIKASKSDKRINNILAVLSKAELCGASARDRACTLRRLAQGRTARDRRVEPGGVRHASRGGEGARPDVVRGMLSRERGGLAGR